MKNLSALAAILLLAGCSTTSTDKTEQVVEEVVTETQVVVEEVAAPISLTVITNPADARVRIMNINPVYKAGIELKEGKYDIEVSKAGYLTYRKWVSVDKKTILTVELDTMEASQSAQ
ncbi:MULTISPECIES: PEGA domain-containing protein [Pseudoalteromonas]|uniref:PEGA domain-containing protein n=1 Tax=Pseudoalteromonas TaxID=53246 RepID=UPI00040197FC|nr:MULTISPECIES: PEGA domain-containing protein [Pseudoalteromonas]MBH0000341.1 PEGA domain-containing protein [Pseudoalteromonas sp. NSLLW24]MBH0079402.1 PEGA domain-containing protein [Pseudoalteromonas sp. NZS11]PKG64563.1 PEGA domain-containing protein [Pseudoalteromonas arctica]PKG71672.1 PEGA domain-containing protein [Pseudoalteromonas sp. GutCa3]